MKYSLLLALFLPLTAVAQAPGLFKDTNPGWGYGMNMNCQLQPYNGDLYFVANTPATGQELFRTDGKQVQLAYDIVPGTNWGLGTAGYQFPVFGIYHNKLYYAGMAPGGGELFATDSTGRGKLLYTLSAGQGSDPQYFTEFDNRLFFSADSFDRTNNAQGHELYAYDGLSRPRRINVNIHNVAGGSDPRFLVPMNGKRGNRLYFISRISATVWSLHELDAAGNCSEVPGARGITAIRPPVVIKNTMYFAGRTPANGSELYSFDGDAVRRLTDLAPGATSGLDPYPGLLDYVYQPCEYKGELFFGGSTDSINFQLYALDLQTQKIRLAATVNPSGSANIGNLYVYNGALYFTAVTPATGIELHRYDGSSEQLVADIWPGAKSGFGYAVGDIFETFMPGFQLYKGQLYFAAQDSVHGHELWRLGTPAGTGIERASWGGHARVAPNPAPGDAALELDLPAAAQLNIVVMDMSGRSVYTPGIAGYPAGTSRIPLPLAALPKGTYFYRVTGVGGSTLAGGSIVH